MIIQCPTCERKFQVPDTAFDNSPEGRNVKCAACSHRWFQKKPECPPAHPKENKKAESLLKTEVAVLEVMLEDSRKEAQNLKKEDRAKAEERDAIDEGIQERSGVLSWLLFCIILLLVVPSLLILSRHHVVRYYPKMAPIYNTAGLKVHVPEQSFQFQHTSWSEVIDHGHPSLYVKGDVVYQPEEEIARTVPLVQVSVYGEGTCTKPGWFKEMFEGKDPYLSQGLCLLDHWTFHTADNLALPGEVISFEAVKHFDAEIKPKAVVLEFAGL